MKEKQIFSQELEEYVVLKLSLVDFTGGNRSLPKQFELLKNPSDAEDLIRADEQRLLKLYFRNWQGPFYRQIYGWRVDTPIFILHNGRLIGGVYLCDKNEFDDNPYWGQLHYAFIDPQLKGQGIYSVIFRDAVERARAWGLQGLYLNSDRFMLPDMYERWGAIFWKKIQKQHVGLIKRFLLRCKNLLNRVFKRFTT